MIPGFTGNRPSFAFLEGGLDETFVESEMITIVMGWKGDIQENFRLKPVIKQLIYYRSRMLTILPDELTGMSLSFSSSSVESRSKTCENVP